MKISKIFIIIMISITLLFYTYSIGYYEAGSYIWSSDISTLEASSNAISENINENSNVLETGTEIEDNNSFNLESGAAILMEQTTGKILYAHNIHLLHRMRKPAKT